jgi:hypothetical protein
MSYFSSSVVIFNLLKQITPSWASLVLKSTSLRPNHLLERHFLLLIRRLLTSRFWATRCCGCDDPFSYRSCFVCLALNDIAHRIIIGEALLLGRNCHMLPPPPFSHFKSRVLARLWPCITWRSNLEQLSHRPLTSDNDLLGTSHCYDLTVFPVLISDYLHNQWLFLHVSLISSVVRNSTVQPRISCLSVDSSRLVYCPNQVDYVLLIYFMQCCSYVDQG